MESQDSFEEYFARHYIHRSNWIRASVLGANDGILSTASLAMGVVAASDSKEAVILSVIAGIVAGALSMAAGEYVSVSSQTDLEQADIERERQELKDMPMIELERLAEIYEQRGLTKETAKLVAKELTEYDALGAHIRDELGINEINKANPIQAAFASGASFTVGGILPLLVVFMFSTDYMELYLYGFSILFLMLLGGFAAKAGGSAIWPAILRITFWGTIAMGLTTLVGYLFGVNLN